MVEVRCDGRFAHEASLYTRVAFTPTTCFADAANAEGGVLYTASRFEEAAEAYARAINVATARTLSEVSANRLAVYYSNRAQARLKLNHNKYAAHDAALALTFDPQLLKALLRYAQAQEALGRHGEARAMAKQLLAFQPPPPEALASLAAVMLRRLHPGPISQGPTSQEVRGPKPTLVHPGQTLRVHFGMPLPDQLLFGCWHTVSLRLSNEMGLFEASTQLLYS